MSWLQPLVHQGDDVTRHDPMWMHASQFGRWCECSCGWRSRNGTVMFAQLAYGRHLLEEAR